MRLTRKYALPWLFGLLLTGMASTVVLEIFPSNVITRIDQFFYDLRMQAQPAQPDPRIVIVDIDEKSLDQIGRWPWSRNVVADLVTSLSERYKVKTIGFDIIFAEPDTSSGYATLMQLAERELKSMPQLKQQLQSLKPELDYDGKLAAAIKDKPVVLGFLFSNEPQSVSKGVLRSRHSPPRTLKDAASISSIGAVTPPTSLCCKTLRQLQAFSIQYWMVTASCAQYRWWRRLATIITNR
jgi:adenylate cyclase